MIRAVTKRLPTRLSEAPDSFTLALILAIAFTVKTTAVSATLSKQHYRFKAVLPKKLPQSRLAQTPNSSVFKVFCLVARPKEIDAVNILLQ